MSAIGHRLTVIGNVVTHQNLLLLSFSVDSNCLLIDVRSRKIFCKEFVVDFFSVVSSAFIDVYVRQSTFLHSCFVLYTVTDFG